MTLLACITLDRHYIEHITYTHCMGSYSRARRASAAAPPRPPRAARPATWTCTPPYTLSHAGRETTLPITGRSSTPSSINSSTSRRRLLIGGNRASKKRHISSHSKSQPPHPLPSFLFPSCSNPHTHTDPGAARNLEEQTGQSIREHRCPS